MRGVIYGLAISLVLWAVIIFTCHIARAETYERLDDNTLNITISTTISQAYEETVAKLASAEAELIAFDIEKERVRGGIVSTIELHKARLKAMDAGGVEPKKEMEPVEPKEI